VTSALVRGEWLRSYSGRFTSGGKATGTVWIGGWVGSRAGLDDVKKRTFLTLPGFEMLPMIFQPVASHYTN
jgi:hypothetical protein